MGNILHEKISDLPPEERPRERMASRGVQALSDLELIALILGSGGGGKSLGQLSLDVLNAMEAGSEFPSTSDLTGIAGIGPARAAVLAGSIEFARRRLRPSKRRITEPSDVLPLVSHWSDRPQEYFLVISLNGAHEVIRLRVVSQGILDRTVVHPREVFVEPITDRAAAIICAHNHPSGRVNPSPEDRDLTQRLKKAGIILGIPLLDHMIFGYENYYSFLENGDFD